jgi:hypothetical protein
MDLREVAWGKVWTEFTCLGKRPVGTSWEYGNEHRVSMKGGEFLD